MSTDQLDTGAEPPADTGSVTNADIMVALQTLSQRLAWVERDVARIVEALDLPADPGEPEVAATTDAPFGEAAARGAPPVAATAELAEAPRDDRRGNGRAVLTMLFAIALLGGGIYWLYDTLREPPQPADDIAATGERTAPDLTVGSAIDPGDGEEALVARAGSAAGAPADSRGSDSPVPDEPAAEDPPVEDAASIAETADPPLGDVSVAGPSPQADDGSAAAESDTAEQVAAIPNDSPDVPAVDGGLVEGPPITAAPLVPVEELPLREEVSVGEGLALLPDDASDNLRALAQGALDGDPDAQNDLANLYAIGLDGPPDYDRAAFWYRRSADAGVPNARYNLGVLLDRGLGVEPDPAAAFELFRMAAEEGMPAAQTALGLAFLYGRGVESDPTQAANWFQIADANGSPEGAYYLGRMFEQGVDGVPDVEAARGWFRRSANRGFSEAQAALDRLQETDSDAPLPASGIADAGEPSEIEAEAETGDENAGTPEVAEAVEPAVPVPDATPEPVAPGASVTAPLTRDQVREVQELLAELGFDPGPVDGLLGRRTSDAIEGFQQSRNLPVDGRANAALLLRLRQAADQG